MFILLLFEGNCQATAVSFVVGRDLKFICALTFVFEIWSLRIWLQWIYYFLVEILLVFLFNNLDLRIIILSFLDMKFIIESFWNPVVTSVLFVILEFRNNLQISKYMACCLFILLLLLFIYYCRGKQIILLSKCKSS